MHVKSDCFGEILPKYCRNNMADPVHQQVHTNTHTRRHTQTFTREHTHTYILHIERDTESPSMLM